MLRSIIQLNKRCQEIWPEKKGSRIEMKQLHNRVLFEAIRVEDLTELEKRHAMESLMFLVERALKAGLVQMEFLNENLWKETRQLVPPPPLLNLL